MSSRTPPTNAEDIYRDLIAHVEGDPDLLRRAADPQTKVIVREVLKAVALTIAEKNALLWEAFEKRMQRLEAEIRLP